MNVFSFGRGKSAYSQIEGRRGKTELGLHDDDDDGDETGISESFSNDTGDVLLEGGVVQAAAMGGDHTQQFNRQQRQQPYRDDPHDDYPHDEQLFTIGSLGDDDGDGDDDVVVVDVNLHQQSGTSETINHHDDDDDIEFIATKPSMLNRVGGFFYSAQRAKHEQISNTSELALPTHHHHHNSKVNSSAFSTEAPATTTGLPMTIPSNYICPLTLQVYDDPVYDRCGHIFERAAILEWLDVHDICPVSRKPCCMTDLQSCTALKHRIDEWKHFHNIESGTIFPQMMKLEQVQRYHQQQQKYQKQQQNISDAEEHDADSSNHSSANESYSAVELMLLPQERKVIHLVRIRAQGRLRHQRKQRINCTFKILVFVALVVIISYLVMRMQNEDY